MNVNLQTAIKVQLVQRYFMERYNPDGGFTLVPPLASSIEDTFYALYSLSVVGFNGISLDKTLSFLLNYPISSIRVAYFALKTLKLLAKHLFDYDINVTEFTHKLLNTAVVHVDGSISMTTRGARDWKGSSQIILEHKSVEFEEVEKDLPFKSIDLERLTLFEMPTKLEEIYQQIFVLKAFKFPFKREKFVDKILSYKSKEGGFGSRNNPNIEETHYAILALKELDYPNSKLQDTVVWLRRCENPDGSFRINPHTIIEASLDYIYYGVRALLALGEVPNYKRKIINIVKHFQNGNGGFRRYIRFGVSKPEYTFQSLFIVHTLIKLV